MNIAILGFGLQGKSALEYWTSPDNKLTICDANSTLSLPENTLGNLGPDYLKNLGKFDLVVRSPSVHPKDIFANNPDLDPKKITSVTNEFMRVRPTKNIIGVTGTKGKGTTSTLIAKMLGSSGKRVHLGGNIGTPPLEMLKSKIQPEDWVVLELANFQLIDLRYSPHIAVCLMVVPEHMDWHQDFEEYKNAKQQLFARQTEADIAIFKSDDENSAQIASLSKAQKIPYFSAPGAFVEDNLIKIDDQIICNVSDVKLLGKHNLQNICAGVTAVWQIDQNINAIKNVITNFSGMEYRLELIRELNGVKYYNDSFGTTPETAIVALEAFDEPKIIILGGSDKEADFTTLANAIGSRNVKYAIIIGDTAPKIEKALKDNQVLVDYTILESTNMKEIVELAKQKSTAGDIVLLSTACASFGMFDNYKDRGDQFNQAVNELAQEQV